MKFGSFKNTVVATTALVLGLGVSSATFAKNLPLPAEDAPTTIIIDKSVLSGEIRKEGGNMVIDPGPNGVIDTYAGVSPMNPANDDRLMFDYVGDIYSVKTDEETGEMTAMDEKIGTIEGTAAFPVSFAYLSSGFKAIMDLMESGYSLGDAMGAVGITKMPPVLEWTCNHCKMEIAGSTYVNIVDALSPVVNGEPSPYYNPNPDGLPAILNGMIDDGGSGAGGATAARESMRLSAKAYLGLTPTAMDPVAKTMGIRMAGCSAIVGVAGNNAGKMGTLCLNSTATFNVSEVGSWSDIWPSGPNGEIPPVNPAAPITGGSSISGTGSSNCVTVLHTPTMP